MFLLSAQQCPAPPAVEPAAVLLSGEVEPTCDAVSGLLSREAFLRAADRLGQVGQNLAMLTLDIERFTELNEHFGLGCGDFLLCQLGLRCEAWAESLSGRAVVGRVGADEFAIAWLPLQEEALAALQELAADLHTSVSGPYELGLSRPLAVEVQVGVAAMKADARQAAETLLHATVARQGAQTGRGRVHRYETHAVERRVGQRLHDLVQERRFAIALQPKVELRTGKLSGFEALARWPEGAGEIVSPDVFIPQAERMGLINQLGDCVLEQALQWQRGLPQCVPVAVNFSAPQFARHDLIDHLLTSLERHALPPGALELELTETVLLDDAEAAVQTLARLRELGLKLAIDDFGTGYSSLSYLCRFSVDRLKLDRSFVARLCDDARTQALVRSVIAIAHELGLQCVAEGIETHEQLAMLIALGCDEGQGYLLSRPLDPAAAHTLALGTAPWQSLLRTLPPPVPAPLH